MKTEKKVIILNSLIIVFFAVLAKVDYAIHGYKGYYPPEEVVSYHWFWQWTIGIPVLSLSLATAFWTGAPFTKHNRKITLGIFLTPMLLLIGQLEDFFYFSLNGLPFPEGEWTWFRNAWIYKILGTWNTTMHFLWLALWLLVTALIWTRILKPLNLTLKRLKKSF